MRQAVCSDGMMTKDDMGYRLSKIITKTGDGGETGLGDGSRVAKDHARVEAMGDVDELNAAVGVLLGLGLPEDIRHALAWVQHHLFDVGAELAVPGYVVLQAAHVAWLEQMAAQWHADLPPLQEFILPGGCAASAEAHRVRTVCRRAERRCVTLHRLTPLNPLLLQYLNRLSDGLFILARHLNRLAGTADVLWHKTEWDAAGMPCTESTKQKNT